MKLFLLIFLSASLMLSAGVSGQWRDRQGHPLEDTASMKSNGDFGAQLIVIGDEEAFFRRWLTPSAEVRLDTVSEVERGGSVIVPVIFSGCRADASGNCDVTADYTILRPDGSVYAESNQVEIWRNRPAPPPGLLELAVEYMKLIIEPSDPEGAYTILARVTDHVLDVSLVLTQHVTVLIARDSGGQAAGGATESDELSHWLTYYYREPHSDRDIDNVLRMLETGYFDKPTSAAPLVTFLAEFFRQNARRMPGWERTLHGMRLTEASPYLLQALWQSNTPNALKVLDDWPNGPLKQVVEQVKRSPQLDLKTMPVDSPEVLDRLWGAFLASGEAIYVERIIEVLALPTDVEDQDTRINNLILKQSAKWSLTSNAEQHERVFEICRGAIARHDGVIRDELADVLVNARTDDSELH